MAKTDLRPWLQARLGPRIERHGVEWAIPCPTCDAGRAKEFRLWFNVEKNVGTCYKCARAFNTVKLVQALEGVSFTEALRLVKEHTATGFLSMVLLKQKVEQAFAPAVAPLVEALPELPLPEGFKACADNTRWPAYLDRIGSRKVVLNYGLGWCSHGYYRDRLIIPMRLHGVLVSFVARDMTGKAAKKVLYPKGTKTSRVLFNYDRAREFERVVLVEGVLDALRVGPRAMAILGTTLSDAQFSLLANTEAREVVLMLDGDTAGQVGTYKALKRLRSSFKVIPVRLADGKDPDDYLRSELRALEACALQGGAALSFAARIRSLVGR